MTSIQGAKRVTRLTDVYTRHGCKLKATVVSLAAEGIYLKGQGLRTWYLLPYAAALDKAQKLAADAIRAERKLKKKQKKEGTI